MLLLTDCNKYPKMWKLISFLIEFEAKTFLMRLEFWCCLLQRVTIKFISNSMFTVLFYSHKVEAKSWKSSNGNKMNIYDRYRRYCYHTFAQTNFVCTQSQLIQPAQRHCTELLHSVPTYFGSLQVWNINMSTLNIQKQFNSFTRKMLTLFRCLMILNWMQLTIKYV